MVNAKRKEVAYVATETNVAASKSEPASDRGTAKEFCSVVIHLSAAELAQTAHRTKSAAKGWKDASRAPSLASAINMAREIPAVKAWIIAQMGGVDPSFYEPQAQAIIATLLKQLQGKS